MDLIGGSENLVDILLQLPICGVHVLSEPFISTTSLLTKNMNIIYYLGLLILVLDVDVYCLNSDMKKATQTIKYVPIFFWNEIYYFHPI